MEFDPNSEILYVTVWSVDDGRAYKLESINFGYVLQSRSHQINTTYSFFIDSSLKVAHSFNDNDEWSLCVVRCIYHKMWFLSTEGSIFSEA